MTSRGLTRTQQRQASLIGMLGYPLIALLGKTYRWEVHGQEHVEAVQRSTQPPIFAFWHGRILPATYFWRRRDIVVMTSENFDGEWIARIIERFGYRTARGSTSRGGARALAQLRRTIRQGLPAAFTVDGPRGPSGSVQPGAVWLASLTGSPILPFHMEAARHWAARSWDRTQIPRPFTRVAVAIGPPIRIPHDPAASAIEAGRASLEASLVQLAAQARAIAADPRPQGASR